MLQLASTDLVGLLWLDKLPDNGDHLLERSPTLRALLESSLRKVGVGSKGDVHALLRYCSGRALVSVEGVVDLGEVVTGPAAVGLRKACGIEEEEEEVKGGE